VGVYPSLEREQDFIMSPFEQCLEALSVLQGYLHPLSAKEKVIILNRLITKTRMCEVAKVLNISQARAYELYHQGMKKLNKDLVV